MRQSVQSAINLDICMRALDSIRNRDTFAEWVPPVVTKHPEGSYTRVILRCPTCHEGLATYKEGPGWCENGLAQAELHNCRNCYQKIDYRKIPISDNQFHSRKN